jgi:LPXTG-motif cell wall-anchored protein
MAIGVGNALALGRWHGFRGVFSHGDLAWLLIGAALVGVAIWALARRRRRWGWKSRL